MAYCQLLSNQISSSNLCFVLKPCSSHLFQQLFTSCNCSLQFPLQSSVEIFISCGTISMKNKQDERQPGENIKIKLQKRFFSFFFFLQYKSGNNVPNCLLLSNRITESNLCSVLKPCLSQLFRRLFTSYNWHF